MPENPTPPKPETSSKRILAEMDALSDQIHAKYKESVTVAGEANRFVKELEELEATTRGSTTKKVMLTQRAKKAYERSDFLIQSATTLAHKYKALADSLFTSENKKKD